MVGLRVRFQGVWLTLFREMPRKPEMGLQPRKSQDLNPEPSILRRGVYDGL